MVQGEFPPPQILIPAWALTGVRKKTIDLPPLGGYAPIQYKRNIPARGFRPAYYLAAVLGVCSFGFYKWIHASHELKSSSLHFSVFVFVCACSPLLTQEISELGREKIWARLHLTPLLEAESDRDLVRRQLAAEEREKILMGDVKGWKFGSVYNTDKVIRPTYGYGPREVSKEGT